MKISLNGYNNLSATFECESDVTAGGVVMTGDSKVKNSSDGEDLIGICTSVRGNTATVLMQGYVEMNYTGTNPSVGYGNIVASGKTTVKVGDSFNASKKRLIVKVDSNNKIIGFIL